MNPSFQLGTSTSAPEVTQISGHGLWLLVGEQEYFLDYTHFPWFRSATVAQVQNVKELHAGHYYWPELEVDLSQEVIISPEKFPLLAR